MHTDEINPSSIWYKFTYQGRAFYQDNNTATMPCLHSRIPPPEGIRGVREMTADEADTFEFCWDSAERMDVEAGCASACPRPRRPWA